ncbi:hypothetical protein QZH41_000329 [Actinostola sp. cb2023]|nr:hypothetical protein QZH41_000329 [Actinostola sp. cb2023]
MWGRNTSKTDEEDVTSAVFQSQFVVVDSVSSIPTNSRANYVLVIPRRIKKSSGTMILERNDQQAASIAGRMMDAMNNLDGLACLPRKLKNKTGKQVEEVINENKILKTQVADMTKSLGICKMEIQNVLTKFEGLEDKDDDLEMYTRKYNLEIHGIPVTKEEDLEEIVIKVAESVGVDIDDDDIDIVHRLPHK